MSAQFKLGACLTFLGILAAAQRVPQTRDVIIPGRSLAGAISDAVSSLF